MTGVLEVPGPGLGLLALGCVLLTWGAEEFMEHLAGVARLVGLPMLALALLLAGAEPEELATAVIASAQGHPVLAATDAVGANVTMLTLGLGLALLVQPVRGGPMLRRYALFAGVAGVAAVLALWDGTVGRWEGAVLCALFVAVVAFIWRTERRPPAIGELAEQDDHADDAHDDAADADDAHDDEADDDGSHRIHGADPAEPAGMRTDPEDAQAAPGAGRRPGRRDVAMLLAGLFAMVLGGALAVDGAARIASAAGLGQHATGLTALAFATSAEVLALVFAARRRRLTQVAVAGVLGAALYNATLTLGVSALVSPLEAPGLVDVGLLATVLPLAVLVTVRGRVPRLLGGPLGAGYGGYLVAVFRGWL